MRRETKLKNRSLLESLESRTLLSVTVAPGGKSATYTDVDGDLVTVKISAGTLDPANFTTVASGLGQSVTFLDLTTDNAAGANLSITALKKPGGDGLVNIGYIDSQNFPLGAVTVGGDLGRIVAGNGTSALKSLTVRSMGRLGGDNQLLHFPTLVANFQGAVGSISVKTDLVNCTINVTGTCGPVTVGGSFLSATLTSTDNMGLVKIAGDVIGNSTDNTGNITSQGKIAGVTIGGSLIGGAGERSGDIASGLAMGPVKIGGSMVGNTGIFSGEVVSSATIAGISVAGSLVGGAGAQSGEIQCTASAGNISIGGSVVGGLGEDSGEIIDHSSGVESIKIGRDIIGSGSYFAGAVTAENLKSFTVGGSIIGGDSTDITVANSGVAEINNVGTVKIGGDLVGSDISSSGFFMCNQATSVAIAGSILGGSSTISGGAEIIQAKTILVGGDILGGQISGASDVNRSGYLMVSIAGGIMVNGSVIAGANNSTGKVALDGVICINDHADSVSIKGNLRGATGTGGVTQAAIIARGDNNPLSSVNFAIKTIKIGGSVELAQILAGYLLDIDHFSPSNHDVQINSISVGGEWAASSIAVGAQNVGSNNLNFGDNNDAVIAGGNVNFVSSINSLTIAGEVTGTPANISNTDHFGFVADAIGSLKIDGNSIAPATSTALGSAGDFTIELV